VPSRASGKATTCQTTILNWELASALVEHIEEIHEAGTLRLDNAYVAAVVKYRKIIQLMEGFFCDMINNNKKNSRFDHAKLKRLLKETSFL